MLLQTGILCKVHQFGKWRSWRCFLWKFVVRTWRSQSQSRWYLPGLVMANDEEEAITFLHPTSYSCCGSPCQLLCRTMLCFAARFQRHGKESLTVVNVLIGALTCCDLNVTAIPMLTVSVLIFLHQTFTAWYSTMWLRSKQPRRISWTANLAHTLNSRRDRSTDICILNSFTDVCSCVWVCPRAGFCMRVGRIFKAAVVFLKTLVFAIIKHLFSQLLEQNKPAEPCFPPLVSNFHWIFEQVHLQAVI